jgi:RIO-like serine/threonine protein kinase
MSSMSPFEQHLHSIIMEKIQANEKTITKKDAKEIVKAIVPELNELVSEIIKEHFRSLAKHILEKFNSKE